MTDSFRVERNFTMSYYNFTETETKSPAEGVEIRVVPGDKMTLVFFYLAPGAVIPEHSHPHEQIGTILKGSLELSIGEDSRIVVPGQAWVIPSDVPHRGKNLEAPAEIIEVFSPPREDLVKM
jgi:quercetin dioxygenase-like cupin family protein